MRARLWAMTGFLLALPAAAGAMAPARLTLSYDGVLEALHVTGETKVLDLTIRERAGSADYETVARMKSSGILSLFRHIDVTTTASGTVAGGLPMPQRFAFQAIEKRRVRHALLTWTADDVVAAPPPKDPGDPAPTLAQKREAADPVTMFSRVLYAASPQLLCGRSWRFFDGAELYELRLEPPAPARLTDGERSLGLTSAVRCQVHYAEIAGFSHRRGERRDEGLQSAITTEFARLGAEGPWIPLSMKADTVLGYARVRLSGLKTESP